MYKNKKFDYDLWTTNDNGIKRYWVRIRATQEVVEVDLETLRFLRTEEKKLNRYRENMLKNNITLHSYDAYDTDYISSVLLWENIDFEEHIISEFLVKNFLDTLTEKQYDVYVCVLKEGEKLTSYAQRKNTTYQNVQNTINGIKKKFKIFFG